MQDLYRSAFDAGFAASDVEFNGESTSQSDDLKWKAAEELAPEFDAWRGEMLPATYDEALDQAAGAMRAASDEAGWRALAEIAFSHYPVVEIVGKGEAAAMFGKNPNNLKRDVPELPDPEWELKATPVWRREVIQAIVDARTAAAQKGGE